MSESIILVQTHNKNIPNFQWGGVNRVTPPPPSSLGTPGHAQTFISNG